MIYNFFKKTYSLYWNCWPNADKILHFYKITQMNDHSTNCPSWVMAILKVIWKEMHDLWYSYTADNHTPITNPKMKQHFITRVCQLQDFNGQKVPHYNFSFHFREINFCLSSCACIKNWFILHEDNISIKIQLYCLRL